MSASIHQTKINRFSETFPTFDVFPNHMHLSLEVIVNKRKKIISVIYTNRRMRITLIYLHFLEELSCLYQNVSKKKKIEYYFSIKKYRKFPLMKEFL